MDAKAMAARMDAELGGGGLFGEVAAILGLTEVAEEEINRGARRSRSHADTLYHSFKLLAPTGPMADRAEFVYRSHVRELLARVIAGQDTRPGTAAEICLACSQSSTVAPLTDTGAGLYGRMWVAAGFPADHFMTRQEHHEALSASLIDDAEREMRRKLSDPDRKLGAIECQGMHHGREVACQYAAAEVPARPVQLALIA